MPVFVSVTVTLTLPTAAPDESVTAPSKVAFTAWPRTCAEHAKRTNRIVTAALISPNLTKRPADARSHSELSFSDFRGLTPKKDMLKRLLMTLPHSARKLVFFKKPAWNWFQTITACLACCQVRSSTNPFLRLGLRQGAKTVLSAQSDRALACPLPTGSPRNEEPRSRITPAFRSAAIPPSACEPRCGDHSTS